MSQDRLKIRIERVLVRKPRPIEHVSPDELVKAHEKCSETIRRTMLTLLGFCFFCIVTTFGAPDASLLMGDATISIPFAETRLSMGGAAPSGAKYEAAYQ